MQSYTELRGTLRLSGSAVERNSKSLDASQKFVAWTHGWQLGYINYKLTRLKDRDFYITYHASCPLYDPFLNSSQLCVYSSVFSALLHFEIWGLDVSYISRLLALMQFGYFVTKDCVFLATKILSHKEVTKFA
jgi:hypothetical protein